MSEAQERVLSPEEANIAKAALNLLLWPNTRRSILVQDLGGSLGLSPADTETWLKAAEQRAAPDASHAMLALARECRDSVADGIYPAAELAVIEATGCTKAHARAWVRELNNALVPPPPLSAVCLDDLRGMPMLDRLQAIGVSEQDLLELVRGAEMHRAGDEMNAVTEWAETKDRAAGLVVDVDDTSEVPAGPGPGR